MKHLQEQQHVGLWSEKKREIKNSDKEIIVVTNDVHQTRQRNTHVRQNRHSVDIAKS